MELVGRPVGVERRTPPVPEQVEPTPSHFYFVDRYLFSCSRGDYGGAIGNSSKFYGVSRCAEKRENMLLRQILHLFLWLRLYSLYSLLFS